VRVALDTNVLVSAVATRGLCADLFQALLAEHDVVVGDTVLSELPRVLRQKLRVPADTVAELDAYLRRHATIVKSAPGGRLKGLNAADAAVVLEAVRGGAQVLVTGDGALLALTKPPVKIVSPRGLWDLLRRAT
jgi:putative PIN family toxin of toxin-antitoxin system